MNRALHAGSTARPERGTDLRHDEDLLEPRPARARGVRDFDGALRHRPEAGDGADERGFSGRVPACKGETRGAVAQRALNNLNSHPK